MSNYKVQVRIGGKIKSMEISASTPEMARKQAKRFGTVMSITSAHKSGMMGGGMRASDRYVFMMRLSTMLASKVGATEALRLLRDSFGGKISAAAATLLEKVELGVDLPTAIAQDTKNFPGAVGLIVKVGAQAGQTYMALKEAAEFEHKLHSVKTTSNRGVIGAVISFIIAGALLIASTMWIGPRIMKMTLISTQNNMVDIGWVNATAKWGGIFMIVILTIVMGFFWLATVGRRLFPAAADRVIMKVPYYREMVLSQDNYINLHRLSLLVRSGVRMEDALKTSFESCRAGALKQDFGNALDALRKGQKWASGMKTLHPTDRAALMLAADRDQISQNLEAIGEQYQSIYIQRISTFAPFMQILAAFAITISGIVLFGQSIMPMLQVSAGLMK